MRSQIRSLRSVVLAMVLGLVAVSCGTATGPLVDTGPGAAPPADQRQAAPPQPEPSPQPEDTSDQDKPKPRPGETTRPQTARDSTQASDHAPAEPRRSPSEPTDSPERPLEVGDRGEAVAELQRRLHSLGYWVGPRDGVYGELTRQAVYAFQAVEDLTVDGIAGQQTLRALAEAQRATPHGGEGDRIEVDLADQVLMLVRDGRVAWVFNAATGTGEAYQHPDGHTAIADTPRGRHEIFWRVDGWRESDLGRLYRPAYFHEDGLAIHGFPEVPPHRASHGCVRVTIDAMDFLWAQGAVPDGQTVLVH